MTISFQPPNTTQRAIKRLASTAPAAWFLSKTLRHFDRGVLAACCDVWLLPMPDVPFLCTVRLARAVWNLRPTGLAHCARFLCVPLNHHEALSDANACAEIVIAAEIEGWRFSPADPCTLPNPLSLRQYSS